MADKLSRAFDDLASAIDRWIVKGGRGSGFFGHAGRPGEIGGSSGEGAGGAKGREAAGRSARAQLGAAQESSRLVSRVDADFRTGGPGEAAALQGMAQAASQNAADALDNAIQAENKEASRHLRIAAARFGEAERIAESVRENWASMSDADKNAASNDFKGKIRQGNSSLRDAESAFETE